MNLPNKLTVSRFFMTFAFVGLMAVENVFTYLAGYTVFVIASITDYYDGKIAREQNLSTNFGKLMDPLADKVLVVAAFLIMMKIDQLWVPAWTVVVILAREFLVTGMRMLAASDGQVIAAAKFGKTKTLLQMIYVFTFLMLATILLAIQQYESLQGILPGDLHLYQRALWYGSGAAMIFVAVYTVYSGLLYIRINWKNLNLDDI